MKKMKSNYTNKDSSTVSTSQPKGKFFSKKEIHTMVAREIKKAFKSHGSSKPAQLQQVDKQQEDEVISCGSSTISSSHSSSSDDSSTTSRDEWRSGHELYTLQQCSSNNLDEHLTKQMYALRSQLVQPTEIVKIVSIPQGLRFLTRSTCTC